MEPYIALELTEEEAVPIEEEEEPKEYYTKEEVNELIRNLLEELNGKTS